MSQQVRLMGKMRQISDQKAFEGSSQRQQRQAHRDLLVLERQASADEAFARAEQVRQALDRAAASRARSEGAKQEIEEHLQWISMEFNWIFREFLIFYGTFFDIL